MTTPIILLFAALVLLTGTVLAARPAPLLGWMRDHADAPWLHALAVSVRLLLGVLLIVAADASRLPLVVAVLGWITLFAGIGLAAIGRDRFRRFVTWALGMPDAAVRTGGVLAALFGAFLIYAFV